MPAFTDLRLRTSRLELRPLVQDDAVALFSIFSDPQVMSFWSSPPWSSLEISWKYIEREEHAMAEGKHLRLGITSLKEGSLLGTCTLFNHSLQSRRAEVGFALSRAAWGCGYASEALRELLAFGFGDMGLNRVEADVDPRNGASARCLERLEFRKEGHLRERWIVGDEVADSVLYGLLRADFKAGHHS
jgi:RimJ/RimL family protein N-acetyltransferase